MQLANEAPVAFRSSATRPGPLALITTAVQEILSRRRLIRYMIGADVKKKGANTVLGNVWWILDPLLATGVYVVVMTLIFQRRLADFPLFLLAAVVPFKWFTATISDTTGSVTRQERLIKQIQFPKIVLPITAAGAEVVSFSFGVLVVLGVLFVAYADHASPMLLWIPVIAAVQFVFTLGIALVLSAVTVFYRDIGILIGHSMRLLFFLSPILWSFEALGQRGDDLRASLGDIGFSLLEQNPIAILLTAYRHVIYGVVAPAGETWSAPVPPNIDQLAVVLVIGLAICAVGMWVFKRLEPAFAKVL